MELITFILTGLLTGGLTALGINRFKKQESDNSKELVYEQAQQEYKHREIILQKDFEVKERNILDRFKEKEEEMLSRYEEILKEKILVEKLYEQTLIKSKIDEYPLNEFKEE